MLAMLLYQTMYHMRLYASGQSRVYGKLFFGGCLATAGANLFLMILLGIHDESKEPQQPADTGLAMLEPAAAPIKRDTGV
jgi:hypothetical protein